MNSQNVLIKEEVLPSWDLSDLYTSPTDERIEKDLTEVLNLSKKFKDDYKNKLAELSPDQFLQAVKLLEELNEKGVKPLCYAHLLHASDSSKAEYGALLSKLEEKVTEISEQLTFFNLEWNLLEEEVAEKIYNAKELEKYKHYLLSARRYKPHQLSEKEEVLLQKVNLTNGPAWTRLFDETISRIKFKISLEEGKTTEMSEEEVLSLLYSPDREVRAKAAQSLTEGLKSQAELLTYIFNVLTQGHYIEDKFRNYSSPMSSRNLSNEISDDAVKSLMESTQKNVSLVPRFYGLKKKLLGLTELKDYDRYAPLPQKSQSKWSWKEAENFVTESYASFSPEFADIVKKFFVENWIDADLRKGKRGGAFSASTVPSVHPYILVNYTGTSRDLSTLAHELGHGIHQYLSRNVGYFQADTPLTTAETASVFGEMITFERFINSVDSNEEKLSLLITKLDEIFATVFRQVFMTRFEERLHEKRRSKGELTNEEISELWKQSNEEMFQGSVTLTENYSSWWMYISHFIHSPFYCYAYAFGLLLSITLYAEYKKKGKPFIEKYTKVLSLGGSVEPAELMRLVDVDINHPEFWNNGFKLIEEMIDQAEKLANIK
jgi:oligoendopeptidase F